MNTAAPSVLDPEEHARLIDDIDRVCETANIPKYVLQQSARGVCGPDELEWVLNFRQYRETGKGMVLIGNPSIGPDMRLMALTGALVRNFIDARVMSLSQVLDAAEAGQLPEPTVLMIPNLYGESFGKQLPAWRVQLLYDLLLSRVVAGKPTVSYVQSMSGLEAAYGPQIARYIEQHCKVVHVTSKG